MWESDKRCRLRNQVDENHIRDCSKRLSSSVIKQSGKDSWAGEVSRAGSAEMRLMHYGKVFNNNDPLKHCYYNGR